jgi:hypothetical protein
MRELSWRWVLVDAAAAAFFAAFFDFFVAILVIQSQPVAKTQISDWLLCRLL